MKRLYLCLLAIATIALASCGGHSPLKISKKEILKQCNKALKEKGIDSSMVMVDTGYYELNDFNAREDLKKLEAAGIVTCDVERFAWWETVKEKKTTAHNVDYYYTYSGRYAYTKTEYSTKWVTNYEFNEHFMVKVALTDKAKKYALNQAPQPKLKAKEDKDFRQPVYYDSIYPENLLNYSENWPEIKHPLADEIYAKCKAILSETSTLIDQATNNSYSKPEQKLNTLDKVDNYNCMMSAQKTEIQSERNELEKRIDVLKGNEAYAKILKIHEEATTLLEKAKTCRDIEKTFNKISSKDDVANDDKMSETQSSDVRTKFQSLTTQVNQKSEELGCNTIEEEMFLDDEYELPDDEPEIQVASTDDPQKIAYYNAKKKENKNSAMLFAYVKKAVVARNIQLSQSDDGTTAKAEVIYEINKATDAERVFNRTLNKQRLDGEASFNYYCDKGWVIDDLTVNERSRQNTESKPVVINLSGKVSNPVCMTLRIASDGEVEGAYYYKSSGSNALLSLKGNKEGDQLTLKEYNKKGKQTGSFEGTFTGTRFSGEFENYKGKVFEFDLQEDKGMRTIEF